MDRPNYTFKEKMFWNSISVLFLLLIIGSIIAFIFKLTYFISITIIYFMLFRFIYIIWQKRYYGILKDYSNNQYIVGIISILLMRIILIRFNQYNPQIALLFSYLIATIIDIIYFIISKYLKLKEENKSVIKIIFINNIGIILGLITIYYIEDYIIDLMILIFFIFLQTLTFFDKSLQ